MNHPPEFTDTDPRVMKIWLDISRTRTPGEKLLMALAAGEFAIRLAEAGIRGRYAERPSERSSCARRRFAFPTI